MRGKSLNNRSNCRGRPGIVLLVTLVLLVVLSTLGYTLSNRVAAQRHRDQYIIDYSKARYACDSAVKYALALTTLEEFDSQLISRPNEPDFSDLFALSEVEYQELLAQLAAESQPTGVDGSEGFNDVNNFIDMSDRNDVNDVNDINDVNDFGGVADFNEPNAPTIRGPYGPTWPFITEPVEFEIGSATVKIEIEDENAKYPVGWAILGDQQVQRETQAGLEIFCGWMRLGDEQIDALKLQLDDIAEIKPFKLDFKPITRIERTPATTGTTTSSRGRGRRTARTRITRKTIPASAQIDEQAAIFSKLFHSSLIDAESLARPTIISESRKESALKYMGMWGSRKVNINTAPRHVLEAAFTFGGDADRIAEEIIQRRRIQPFKDIEDLRKTLLRYSDSIRKCEEYITAASSFFTIKVTAVSGVAKASSVVAITKDGEKIERIAVISD